MTISGVLRELRAPWWAPGAGVIGWLAHRALGGGGGASALVGQLIFGVGVAVATVICWERIQAIGARRDRASRPAAREEQRAVESAQVKAYAEDLRRSYAGELRRTQELHDSYLATVRALAAAVEAKDDYTGGHIQRVLQLGVLLAGEVCPAEGADPQLAYGFLLHDVGKLAVPDAVLTKAGALTEEEWALMRHHPVAGARILSNIAFLGRALDVVLYHHERWDGAGYPHGLSGEEIPLWARVFSVVDTVDAITSDRPYRRGRPLAVAVEQVLEGAGEQFDPGCAVAFARLDTAAVEELLQHRPAADLGVLHAIRPAG